MDIEPPIPARTTEQLLDIVETREEWKPEVVELAIHELMSRGIAPKTLTTRRTIKRKFKERVQKIKEGATYSTVEKYLIVFFGPILILLLRDVFLFHRGEGYKRMNRQGIFYVLLGFLFWGLVLYLYLANFNA
jgi:hypothetical protein